MLLAQKMAVCAITFDELYEYIVQYVCFPDRGFFVFFANKSSRNKINNTNFDEFSNSNRNGKNGYNFLAVTATSAPQTYTAHTQTLSQSEIATLSNVIFSDYATWNE